MGGSQASVELELVADAQAPSAARAAVRDLTADNGNAAVVPAATSENLLLLVSEVVTNAVLHSGGSPSPLMLAARVENKAIRVTVTNPGHGLSDDIKRHAGGYGLFLLDKLATRWGIEQTDGATPRTAVWFEMPVI